MDQVLVVSPLLVAVVLLSGLVRLAARFTGRISVSWKHAVVYALVTVLANAGIRMAVVASGVPLPAIVFPVSSLLFQLVLGALYFAQRAKTVDGKDIGARRCQDIRNRVCHQHRHRGRLLRDRACVAGAAHRSESRDTDVLVLSVRPTS